MTTISNPVVAVTPSSVIPEAPVAANLAEAVAASNPVEVVTGANPVEVVAAVNPVEVVAATPVDVVTPVVVATPEVVATPVVAAAPAPVVAPTPAPVVAPTPAPVVAPTPVVAAPVAPFALMTEAQIFAKEQQLMKEIEVLKSQRLKNSVTKTLTNYQTVLNNQMAEFQLLLDSTVSQLKCDVACVNTCVTAATTLNAKALCLDTCLCFATPGVPVTPAQPAAVVTQGAD